MKKAICLTLLALAMTGCATTQRTQTEGYKYSHTQGSYTSPFDYNKSTSAKGKAIHQAYDPCEGCEDCCGKQQDNNLRALRAEPSGCNCFNFDGSKSSDADGDALTYSWNFGDGTTGEGVLVTHCYEKAGKYEVSLLVKDGNGICGDGITIVNVVADFPPVANAGEDKITCIEQAVTFDGGQSTIQSDAIYRWDFGDGASSDTQVGTHVYVTPGQYVATLTVSNASGKCGSSSDTVVIDVKTRPVSVIEVS